MAAYRRLYEASPKLQEAFENSIIDSLATYSEMSKQALESSTIRAGLLKILLDEFGLWETLRQQEDVQM